MGGKRKGLGRFDERVEPSPCAVTLALYHILPGTLERFFRSLICSVSHPVSVPFLPTKVRHSYHPTRTQRVVSSSSQGTTGLSQEQAATALKATGILLVVAGSFGGILERNTTNKFICIKSPEP